MKNIKTIIVIQIFLIACNSNQIKTLELNNCVNVEYTMLSKNDAKKDIEFIFSTLEKTHVNPYKFVSKEKIEAYKSELIGDLVSSDSLYLSDFILKTMKLLSLLEDAHTNIQWHTSNILSKKNTNTLFPLKIFLNNNKIIIGDDITLSAYDGMEVLSINGYDAKELYSESTKCLSGFEEHKEYLSSKMFFSIFLHLKGILPPYNLTFNSGKRINISSEECLDRKKILSQLKPEQVNYSYKILENEIGYIGYHSCNDSDAFSQFLQSTFDSIKRDSIDKLVIDIRFNLGGNSGLNDFLIPYFTKRKYCQASKRIWKNSSVSEEVLIDSGFKEHFGEHFIRNHKMVRDTTLLDFKFDDFMITPETPTNYFKGQACLLIGPGTFSSANNLADAVKTFDLIPVIGKPTGQKTSDFSEMRHTVLPHSKITLTHTIAYDIGANQKFESNASVLPDYVVQGDPLNFAINWLKENTEANTR